MSSGATLPHTAQKCQVKSHLDRRSIVLINGTLFVKVYGLGLLCVLIGLDLLLYDHLWQDLAVYASLWKCSESKERLLPWAFPVIDLFKRVGKGITAVENITVSGLTSIISEPRSLMLI